MRVDDDEMASSLDVARRLRRPIAPLSEGAKVSMSGAYSIQRALVSRHVARGDSPVGLKLAFTNPLKARQARVDTPVAGVLTGQMSVGNGTTVAVDRLIGPRLEPEVAFRFALDDMNSKVLVAPALEVVDSRYCDGAASAADLVADNASAALFVVGRWAELTPSLGARISDTRVRLTSGATEHATGRTSAILGDPRKALELARKLAQLHALSTPSNVILLAGAATSAITFAANNRYTAQVEGLGEVSVAAI